jgi:hypothetical protein
VGGREARISLGLQPIAEHALLSLMPFDETILSEPLRLAHSVFFRLRTPMESSSHATPLLSAYEDPYLGSAYSSANRE